MTQRDDHDPLPTHAEQMLARLETLGSLAIPGRAAHMQHMDHTQRSRQLAGHLRAVMTLIDARRYPSALVVVRTALEHHLTDRLIFLANRWVETYPIKKEDVPNEEAKLAALMASTRPGIARWWWDSSGMNVVIRGLYLEGSNGRGATVSPYYFRADDYDPFTGGKKHAGRLAGPFFRAKHRQEWAAEAVRQWFGYFTYEKLRKALDVNRLLPGQGVQVDVHYSFLSGFVHPSKRGYDAIYGTNFPDRMGSFDHYASELALLYVIVIAAAEIEIYGRMAGRTPRLRLRDWTDVRAEVAAAREASAYFWFLSGGPTMYDRIDEIHTRMGRLKTPWGPPRDDPNAIKDSAVRYYANPLERLVKMHQSYQEIATGVVYRSPFERSDATRRL